jgi:ADP-ribosylglycohydrolase
MNSPSFVDRLTGALCGVAIGDGMGAPVEGWTADKIASRFKDVRSFFPKTGGGDPTSGKGDGRFTDDTLMVETLIRAYEACGDHLDAYGFEQYFLKEMAETPVWLPERKKEMPILNRLWIPEKYPWVRLTMQGAEPRQAGLGNTLICGLAMFMMPVGAVNAGDPTAAYQEAIAFGLAHTHSFALEAAAVMAASYAQAFAWSRIEEVLECAMSQARDGTGGAIASVLASVDCRASVEDFIRRARDAARPFDVRPENLLEEQSEAGRRTTPSRAHSIEELPVALAALKYGDGDFHKTLHAAVFYGRDCDTIAGMAAGLYGALFGSQRIPPDLQQASQRANHRDYSKMAEQFADTIRAILRKDTERWAQKRRTIEAAS